MPQKSLQKLLACQVAAARQKRPRRSEQPAVLDHRSPTCLRYRGMPGTRPSAPRCAACYPYMTSQGPVHNGLFVTSQAGSRQPNLRIERSGAAHRGERARYTVDRHTPLCQAVLSIIHGPSPASIHFAPAAATYYRASSSPTSWGWICPVLIRHRSTARRRPRATAAFLRRALPALPRGSKTFFHRFSGL